MTITQAPPRFVPAELRGPNGTADISPDVLDVLLAAVMEAPGNWSQYAATRLYGDNIGTGCSRHGDDEWCHWGSPITYLSWYDDDSFTDHHTEITYCPGATR